jgi:hypothetical protein
MMPTMRTLPVALLLATLPLAASGQGRPKVAVLDFTANGASKELTSAASSATANELDRLGAFQVITSEAIRALLGFEKQKQMLGCSDAGCISEIGGALGAEYVVSGKVTRLAAAGGVPETVSLDLTLSSVKKGSREGSAIETARSEAELVTRVQRAVGKLVQKVLAGRAGRLVVAMTEAGAVVKVDDQIKGTTPLNSAISLPSGPHTLSVEKQGFVSYQHDIQVEPAKTLEERVSLVPSPDFIHQYEARQSKLRLGAWLSTGAAVVGMAGAVYFQLSADSKYGNETSPGTFLFVRRQILDGNDTEATRAQASSLKSSIESRQTMSYVSAGVGAAAAVAATYFWISGDDPKRYAAYREVASVDVTPLPGGAFAMVTVGF